MRRLLITGGAGFIGSNFVHYWRGAHPEDRIIVLDKLTYAGNLVTLAPLEGKDGYRFVKGDICDFELVDRLFREESVDRVVNFAAESHVDRAILGPEPFIKTNIVGTFVLLEAAKKNWIKDKAVLEGSRFLHVSTDEVYGSLGETGHFTEETPYSPNSPYSASKASSDHLVRSYFHTYGLPVLTTNCSNNYGPYQFPEKLIPLVISNAVSGKPIPVYGDGRNVRDWLYVLDHCSALDAVMSGAEVGEVYNIGGDNEWKNIDIVGAICATLDELVPDSPYKPHSSLIEFVADRPGHDRRYAIDATKIKDELGWAPARSFETGIRETVEWYLTNNDWLEGVMSGDYKSYSEKNYDPKKVLP